MLTLGFKFKFSTVLRWIC